MARAVITPELKTLQLINAFRVMEGLTTVMPHAELEQRAAEHARRMRDHSFVDHRDFEDRGKGWSRSGEVLAALDIPQDQPRRLVDGWIKSRQHRLVLTGDFQFIGVARAANKDRAYWTAILAR